MPIRQYSPDLASHGPGVVLGREDTGHLPPFDRLMGDYLEMQPISRTKLWSVRPTQKATEATCGDNKQIGDRPNGCH